MASRNSDVEGDPQTAYFYCPICGIPVTSEDTFSARGAFSRRVDFEGLSASDHRWRSQGVGVFANAVTLTGMVDEHNFQVYRWSYHEPDAHTDTSDDEEVPAKWTGPHININFFVDCESNGGILVHQACLDLATAWSKVSELDLFKDAKGHALTTNMEYVHEMGGRNHYGTNSGDYRSGLKLLVAPASTPKSTDLSVVGGNLVKGVIHSKEILRSWGYPQEYFLDDALAPHFFRPNRFPKLFSLSDQGSTHPMTPTRSSPELSLMETLSAEILFQIIQWLFNTVSFNEFAALEDFRTGAKNYPVRALSSASKRLRQTLMSPDAAFIWFRQCKRFSWLPEKVETTRSAVKVRKAMEEPARKWDWRRYYLDCCVSNSMLKRSYMRERVLDLDFICGRLDES
ncbi:hypothetical protein HDU67_006715 [Dinochytrium kinnereticum]|nr:hypothetical protein HDU67_006715 [Dinochytrium kinnereticum]